MRNLLLFFEKTGYACVVGINLEGGLSMQLNTYYFGEIEVQDSQIIHFEEGLPGFENEQKFVLLNNYDTEEPVPFMWLQSVKDPDLAFVVTIPFFMRPDYEFDIPNEICEQIDLKSPEQAGVYTICRISGPMESMSLNLRSPIIINAENRKAVQMVLADTKYTTKEVFKK